MFWSSNGSPSSEREPAKSEPPKRDAKRGKTLPRRQRPTPPESPTSKRGSDMPPVHDPLLEDDEVTPGESAS